MSFGGNKQNSSKVCPYSSQKRTFLATFLFFRWIQPLVEDLFKIRKSKNWTQIQGLHPFISLISSRVANNRSSSRNFTTRVCTILIFPILAKHRGTLEVFWRNSHNSSLVLSVRERIVPHRLIDSIKSLLNVPARSRRASHLALRRIFVRGKRKLLCSFGFITCWHKQNCYTVFFIFFFYYDESSW